MTRSIGGVCSLIGRMSTARASTPDTLNCPSKKGKSELASKPGQNWTIGLIPFGGQAGGIASCRTLLLHWPYHQLLTLAVHSGTSSPAHAFCYRKHEL